MDEQPAKKILIVEDDLFIRELYERTLTQAGYQVLPAADGDEGLKLAKDKPDLILLDIMLPKVHGIDVLKKLKQADDTKNIPIVMLTNLGQENIMEQAFKIGAAGYLVKMRFEPAELANYVREFLDGSSSS